MTDHPVDTDKESPPLKIGIDIGSKTIKVVVLDADDATLYAFYERHLSNVKQTMLYALKRCRPYCGGHPLTVGVTGSAGIQFAELMGLPFIQEVLADKLAISRLAPQTDVAIELGGEDSKILFLSGGEELRMNNTCAGGTGGFIDTIAGMFDLNAEEFNNLALGCSTVYPIASRCAVFAQSDVRPLLNEGVSRYDIAGSVFAAVATQCISGLACGRKITGRVALLGGPFHFLSALRGAFIKALGPEVMSVEAPKEAHLFVAKGAAFFAENEPASAHIEELAEKLEGLAWKLDTDEGRLPALFSSEQEYIDFKERHGEAKPKYGHLNGYEGRAYLGIDSGSTTIKCVLIGEQGEFLFTYYERVAGDLTEAVELMLQALYKRLPHMHDGRPALTIAHTCVVGYGEDLILKAFRADSGEVETVAHLRAAQESVPEVDMVLDIGGQDIKYLTVKDGALDAMVLNEACSSGCGALIGGFAYSMNVKLDEFTEAALYAERPVDLGTRCTVFMTSRVRHAQKEGASVGEISAGLAYSVVRNALFKVIRLQDTTALGKHIVVQGGTFRSDAVLRALEQITGREVYRSGASEYMGAFGAALFARDRAKEKPNSQTTLLSAKELKQLVVKRTTTHCTLCANQCTLTISEFSQKEWDAPQQIKNAKATRGRWNNFDAVIVKSDDEDEAESALTSPLSEPRRLIVGNRCTRPCSNDYKSENNETSDLIDLFSYTYERLFAHESQDSALSWRGTIGVLRALGTYDDYPLWNTFLSCLGYQVVLSDPSSRGTYLRGAETILSESACYPTKISNGHLLNLIDKGMTTVFSPYVEYGFSAKQSCSVLAQNPLALGLNIEAVYNGDVRMLSPHLNYSDPFGMVEELYATFSEVAPDISRDEIERALEKGLAAYRTFWADIRCAGESAVQTIRARGGHGIVLAGRPYHLDPEMHHGLPEQLKSFGLSVLTAESVAHLGRSPRLYVDDLWDHPSRVYGAASFAAECDCLDFLEIYSFGCGLDAVTCDQAQDILKQQGRLFTSLKIDEMSDLAATRIRMRSMLAALKGGGGLS
jgi:predicted CoA-substrate-specific enzyme activase